MKSTKPLFNFMAKWNDQPFRIYPSMVAFEDPSAFVLEHSKLKEIRIGYSLSVINCIKLDQFSINPMRIFSLINETMQLSLNSQITNHED